MQEVLVRTSDGRRLIKIDDVFCNSSRDFRGGNEGVAILFLASWISLLSDSPLNSRAKPFRLYRDFLNRILRDGLKAVVLEFSSLSHELVSNHTLMGQGTSIGPWIPAMKDTPVFFEYNRYFKTGDVVLLDFLYTFLNFGKKLKYEDESFNEDAFRTWSDVEKRLAVLEFVPEDLSSLRVILSTLLPTFSWQTGIYPKFGPGSVSERHVRTRSRKIETLTYDYAIDRFILRHPTLSGSDGEGYRDLIRYLIPNEDVWVPDKLTCVRVSSLRFVPKNLKVARSICMEPNTLMYFQQAVMREFITLIEHSPLNAFIDIKDQSRNQMLAYHGSYTGCVDTLDLSSASDSVSLQLVKQVFPADWLKVMLVTRSQYAYVPDGTKVLLEKFAPMGSALCFPTQCIIFASVCIYAGCRCEYEKSCPKQPFLDWLSPQRVRNIVSLFKRGTTVAYEKFGYQPLAVYGDDICVDSKLTQYVSPILQRLGFQLNINKSFTGSQSFRESCGMYCLDGRDITPLYFTVEGVQVRLTPAHVASHVHLINAAFDRGFKNLYRFLRRSISAWDAGKYRSKKSDLPAIPYVCPDSSTWGIKCHAPVNSHLRKCGNIDIHEEEYRHWTISYDFKDDPTDLESVDSYEYMRWWARSHSSDFADPNESVWRSDVGGSRIKWVWTPLY